jgi:hypothetical protein
MESETTHCRIHWRAAFGVNFSKPTDYTAVHSLLHLLLDYMEESQVAVFN